ncbi:MAG TPA: glutaredoxin family protein [Chloroflexota bacterium]|nr:glutaredoxin family protein [Chloroflexota bacterium]
MVKEFLRERDVHYELKDLSRDAQAREDFVRAGYLLPPVTVVDGVAVDGFDPRRLEELLGDAC